jgi:hypothetical protein
MAREIDILFTDRVIGLDAVADTPATEGDCDTTINTVRAGRSPIGDSRKAQGFITIDSLPSGAFTVTLTNGVAWSYVDAEGAVTEFAEGSSVAVSVTPGANLGETATAIEVALAANTTSAKMVSAIAIGDQCNLSATSDAALIGNAIGVAFSASELVLKSSVDTDTTITKLSDGLYAPTGSRAQAGTGVFDAIIPTHCYYLTDGGDGIGVDTLNLANVVTLTCGHGGAPNRLTLVQSEGGSSAVISTGRLQSDLSTVSNHSALFKSPDTDGGTYRGYFIANAARAAALETNQTAMVLAPTHGGRVQTAASTAAQIVVQFSNAVADLGGHSLTLTTKGGTSHNIDFDDYGTWSSTSTLAQAQAFLVGKINDYASWYAVAESDREVRIHTAEDIGSFGNSATIARGPDDTVTSIVHYSTGVSAGETAGATVNFAGGVSRADDFSGPTVAAPGVSQLIRAKVSYRSFIDASSGTQTATIDVFTPTKPTIIECAFMYVSPRFAVSANTPTLSIGTGGGTVDVARFSPALNASASASSNYLNTAVALGYQQNECVLLDPTASDKVTLSIDVGNGQTCASLTAGDVNVYLRHYTFDID